MYDHCEELAGAEADQILRQLRNFSEVRVLPHVDNLFVMDATWKCDYVSVKDFALVRLIRFQLQN